MSRAATCLCTIGLAACIACSAKSRVIALLPSESGSGTAVSTVSLGKLDLSEKGLSVILRPIIEGKYEIMVQPVSTKPIEDYRAYIEVVVTDVHDECIMYGFYQVGALPDKTQKLAAGISTSEMISDIPVPQIPEPAPRAPFFVIVSNNAFNTSITQMAVPTSNNNFSFNSTFMLKPNRRYTVTASVHGRHNVSNVAAMLLIAQRP